MSTCGGGIIGPVGEGSGAFAVDGEGAIEQAEYALPDMIMLDVMMPGIDGFETCKRLKANEKTRDIPIIFMTALADTIDKVHGLSLGAVDYVTTLQEFERTRFEICTRHARKIIQARDG